MIRPDSYDDAALDDDRAETCQTCGGEGEENRCIDDMCSGADECIHGDGMIVCRTCGGAGYV